MVNVALYRGHVADHCPLSLYFSPTATVRLTKATCMDRCFLAAVTRVRFQEPAHHLSVVSSKENLAGLFGRGWLALTSKTQLSPSTRIPCPSAGDQTPHGALLPFHDRRTDTNVRWNRERKKTATIIILPRKGREGRGMDRPSLISSLQPEKRALCLLRRDHRRPEYRPRSCLPIRSEIPSFHRQEQPCVRAGAS